MAARIMQSTGKTVIPPTWTRATRSRALSLVLLAAPLLIPMAAGCASSHPRPKPFTAPESFILHAAAREGDLARVEALLKEGADPHLE